MLCSTDIQLLNPLVAGGAVCDGNDDYDYGFIDLEEDTPMPLDQEEMVNETASDSTTSDIPGPVSGTNSTLSFATSRNTSRAEGAVVCEVICSRAPTTCRSFNRDDVLQTHVSVALSIPKFRIVQTFSGEVAEYLVNVTLNDKEFSSWKRYEDFKQLADACRERSRFLELYDASVQSSKCPSILPLEETLEAWWKVESNRPWWSSPTQPTYITQELQRIKHFMDTFLFEASNLRILYEFMRS